MAAAAGPDSGGMASQLEEGAPEVVLRLVDGVVADLHRRHPPPPASLDSRLERDLGLDSLALAELLVRLEEQFGVRLPTTVLASAETPQDLLRALRAAPLATPPSTLPAYAVPEGPADTLPAGAATLLDVLDWHCATHPDRLHLRLVGEAGPEDGLSYADLRRGAVAVARGLLGRGLEPGASVALMLPTGRTYFEGFLGVLAAGAVPVPIYPPTRPAQLEDHLRRHAVLLGNARAAALITVPGARTVARLLRSSVDTLRLVLTVDELAGAGGGEALPRPGPDATALLQYTSGSTGHPKGVVLSHANLLANIRAMGQAAEVTPHDVFVSWLPLYHDMGLIGAWLGSLCLGMPAVIMPPLTFLARPVRWLQAIDAYRATLTAAPNFAYELCLNKIPDTDLAGIDLSSLRMAFNGAEPVAASTMERFAARFSHCGFRPEALAPVYGLAESAVGLAFPPPGRGLKADRVARQPLLRQGRATPTDTDPVTFVACGRPLPGHEIRVVDAAGRELGERMEGRVEFRGPSATSGYFNNPDATRALFHDDWLDTADLGYLAEGDLYVTGRSKDVIIRAGRNLHPEELEVAVGELAGVRKGCVAAFSSTDRAAGTERLVVLAETRETDAEALEQLRARIVETTVDLLGGPPDDVALAPPGTVLKTSSGKIRRAASREAYEQDVVGRRPRPVWWQLARLRWTGAVPGLRRQRRAVAAVGFAAYSWVLLAAVGLPLLAALALVPFVGWRRQLARRAARSLLRLSGTPLRVHDAARLPRTEPCVVVANHGSWLDAPLLAAWLPPTFVFVAGEVLARQHLTGFALRRIGTEFVERHEPERGVADTARLARLAATRSLVFFPEGELSRAPGLRVFHLGAFTVAAEASRPVVPVAIRGTRSMLRAGHRFVRRGSITIAVGEPIAATDASWVGVLHLEREARSFILRHCGEPEVT